MTKNDLARQQLHDLLLAIPNTDPELIKLVELAVMVWHRRIVKSIHTS